MKPLLDIPEPLYTALWNHLLPDPFIEEEAAFLYVRQRDGDADPLFHSVDWTPVPASGFLSRSPYHFELTDETRGGVIKRAHDLGASLVEFHSHAGDWPAGFSYSDFEGFEEFVPHVLWRLKRRPYLAVVASRSSFDGLVWFNDATTPTSLTGIRVGTSVLVPTGHSIWDHKRYYDERTI